jgi:hypothetical protein
VGTGLYIQPSAAQTLAQQQRTTSSQEEYEEFGSKKDGVMASSNEHTISTIRLVVQPSADPKFKNTIEYRYFKIFQESTVAQLSRYSESSLWDYIVPQACYEEQWAKNVAIAIGALHQYAQSDPNYTTVDSESHYIFALQQYDKGICQFQQRVKPSQSESSVRLALIFTLLTTCFETYIGNSKNAIEQAEIGVDVLLKWVAKKQKESADEADEWSNIRRVTFRSFYLDKDLLDAFQRLDYQVLLCRGLQPGRKAPQAYPTTNCPFTSVDEAYRFCDLVVRRVLHFHKENIKEQRSPPYLKHELYGFRVAMDQFFHSFEPLFQSSRQEPGSKDSLRENLVMIRATACCFAISQVLLDSEMYTNAYLRDYMFINDLARELIDDQRKANFNFDMTLGASIFSVSHYCRDPTVRRAVINLLRQCTERNAWFDTLVGLYCSQLVWNGGNTARSCGAELRD